jgi:hypothetical protein
MRKVLLVTCVLVLVSAASTADARHGRRHWHKYYFAAVPYAYEVGRPGNNLQRRRFGREAVPYAYGFGRPEDNFRGRRQWRESVDPAVMVPPNWQLQPPDPNWGGKRFLSPDGSSWLAVYASLTAAEPIASHMQSIAFAEGETLTYLRGERDWIVVSGTKGDRFFYRKAVIACGGKVWHHMAFEYPAERKQAMDAFVIRAAAIIDLAENDGCEEATSSFNPDR